MREPTPPSGTPEYAEYLRSINANRRHGQAEQVVKFRDDMGSPDNPVVAGTETVHWDGRQDATVIAPTIVHTRPSEES